MNKMMAVMISGTILLVAALIVGTFGIGYFENFDRHSDAAETSVCDNQRTAYENGRMGLEEMNSECKEDDYIVAAQISGARGEGGSIFPSE